MPRGFDEIDDDEWFHLLSDDDDFDLGADERSRRAAKIQRGLKRPHQAPPSRAPPSNGSFRHNPKPSKAAAALAASDSEDDDFDLSADERPRRAAKSQRGLKRPHQGPPSRAPPSAGSFRHNPNPSKAAAALAVSDSEDGEDIPDSVFDLPASSSRTSPLHGKGKGQPVLKRPQHRPHSKASPSIGSFRHNSKPSRAPATTGLSDSEDDDFDLTEHDLDLQASPSRTSRLHGKGKGQHVLKRPQHRPHSQASLSIGSFRHNSKPSRAPATTGLSESEDDDFDISDSVFDLPASPSRTSRLHGKGKGQRVLKRPQHRPDSQASPPIGSFRHNSKPSRAPATTWLSESEDDDFDISDSVFDLPASPSRTSRLDGKGKGQRVLKRPQHRPHSQASPPIGSFRHNSKPSRAPATTGLSESEDDDFDISDSVFDLPASPSRTSRLHGKGKGQHVLKRPQHRPHSQASPSIGSFRHNSKPSIAPATKGLSESEDDDFDFTDSEDGEYNSGRSVYMEEDEGDVVGMALRKCARISADLRQELFGSSARARNIESYAEIDASTCRIVTQEDVDAACTSENSGFDPVLKQYQLVGVNFLLLLHRKSIGGAILADEMGLGKTVQAVTYLTLLRHLYNDPGPHLIVCPASVLENWERELRKWCPSFSVIMFHGAGRAAYSKELSSLGKAGCPAPFTVLLVSYTLFERRSSQQKDDRKALRRWRWSCVLMDEAHVLKDKGSFRWKNLMAVAQHARQRLMLTGTPLQNDLHELWSLLEFMMPDIFATGDVDLKKLLNAEDHELISRIKSILGPFILRRLKSDVMQQLVPKIQHVKFVTINTEQSKAYKNAIDEYRAACQACSARSSVDTTNNVVGLIPKRQISNYFTQFRKIANHPLLIRRIYSDKDVDQIARLLYPKGAFGFECSLERAIQELKNYNDFAIHKLLLSHGDVGTKGALTDEHVFASAKCQALAELLPSLANDGHRVLIFSQWTTMLDILEWALEVIGVTYRRLDVGTPVTERQTIVDTFNNDRTIFACLLSTRAGGQGLNLIGADTVIIHDMDFNSQMDRQAEDRCHCIGQQKPVTIYRLVTKGSVDENIYEIARRKLVLDAAILQSGADLDNSTDVPEKTMGDILASLLLG